MKYLNLTNLSNLLITIKRQIYRQKKKVGSLVNHLKNLLEKKNFFVPEEKRHSMNMNINNLFYRLEANDKELRVLASIISTLAKNSKKP